MPTGKDKAGRPSPHAQTQGRAQLTPIVVPSKPGIELRNVEFSAGKRCRSPRNRYEDGGSGYARDETGTDMPGVSGPPCPMKVPICAGGAGCSSQKSPFNGCSKAARSLTAGRQGRWTPVSALQEARGVTVLRHCTGHRQFLDALDHARHGPVAAGETGTQPAGAQRGNGHAT